MSVKLGLSSQRPARNLTQGHCGHRSVTAELRPTSEVRANLDSLSETSRQEFPSAVMQTAPFSESPRRDASWLRGEAQPHGTAVYRAASAETSDQGKADHAIAMSAAWQSGNDAENVSMPYRNRPGLSAGHLNCP